MDRDKVINDLILACSLLRIRCASIAPEMKRFSEWKKTAEAMSNAEKYLKNCPLRERPGREEARVLTIRMLGYEFAMEEFLDKLGYKEVKP